MLVQQMTKSDCFRVLERSRLGRLGCAHDNQPYIIPIYFVCEEPYLYGFTTPGLKVEWMRSNPLVCVEWDEVQAGDQWTSIVIFGRYEELTEPPPTPAGSTTATCNRTVAADGPSDDDGFPSRNVNGRWNCSRGTRSGGSLAVLPAAATMIWRR